MSEKQEIIWVCMALLLIDGILIYNHDVHEVLSVTYLIGLEQSHLVLVYNERFFLHQNSINKLMFNTFPADIVILGYSVFILLLMKTV